MADTTPTQEAPSRNCAQKVLIHCQKAANAPNETLVLSLRGFGSGVGCGKLCGCVSGGVAAFGQLMPDTGRNEPSKEQAAALVQWFEKEFGTIDCDALKANFAASGDPSLDCPALIERTGLHCVAVLKEMALL